MSDNDKDLDKVTGEPDDLDKELFGMIDAEQKKDEDEARYKDFSETEHDFSLRMTHQQYDVLSHCAEVAAIGARVMGDREGEDLMVKILLILSAEHARQFPGAGDDSEEGEAHE